MIRANRTIEREEARRLSQVIPNGLSFLTSSCVRCFQNDPNAFRTNLKKNAAHGLTIPEHRTNRDVQMTLDLSARVQRVLAKPARGTTDRDMLARAQTAGDQDKDSPDPGKVPARPVDEPAADTSAYAARDVRSAALGPAALGKEDREAAEVRADTADTGAQ